jgi:hypothetical protein
MDGLQNILERILDYLRLVTSTIPTNGIPEGKQERKVKVDERM